MTAIQWLGAAVLAAIAFAVTLYLQRGRKSSGDGGGGADFDGGHYGISDSGGDGGGGD